MTHTDSATEALHLFLENMVSEGQLAQKMGIDASPATVASASYDRIMKIARNDLPLALLLDESDLLFHAEGPGVAAQRPRLSALSWLSATVEKGMRALAAQWLDLVGADGKALARQLDLTLTGVAPGSLWIGTRLEVPDSALALADGGLEDMRAQVRAVPDLIRFIETDRISPAIREAAPDPAWRDTALGVLMDFAPTGRRGIHTIELSSPAHRPDSLGQPERVVLREALKSPAMDDGKDGSFIGEIRAIDMDRKRFFLRDINGVEALRCVLPEVVTREKAKHWIGERVNVTGRYSVDAQQRPRLLVVEHVDVIDRPKQKEITV